LAVLLYLVVCAVALTASLLTFFTGFGLGTLLLPAFVLFFEPEIAVGLTAVVHFLNGLFKLALVGGKANLPLAARFGLPAFGASFLGAWLLVRLARQDPLFTYALGAREHEVTALKLIIGGLMLTFAVLELSRRFQQVSIPIRYAPLGGLLAGFFGGLSGHQGALRSAFLVRAGVSKEAFIGTGVLIAVAVDVSRLSVYVPMLGALSAETHGMLLLAATLSAFIGAFVGSRLLKKVTLAGIQKGVASLLIAVALGLGTGLL
jgi:uncharacterized protein